MHVFKYKSYVHSPVKEAVRVSTDADSWSEVADAFLKYLGACGFFVTDKDLAAHYSRHDDEVGTMVVPAQKKKSKKK